MTQVSILLRHYIHSDYLWTGLSLNEEEKMQIIYKVDEQRPYPETIHTKDTLYKFPKQECEDIKQVMIDYLKSIKFDLDKIQPSKLVSSVIGYDYVLPTNITHDLLNAYAWKKHKPNADIADKLGEDFYKVARVIEELNPILKKYGGITGDHDLHGIASNIHPEDIWGKGLSIPGKNSWFRKLILIEYAKMQN